jgi:hypothetical protein
MHVHGRGLHETQQSFLDDLETSTQAKLASLKDKQYNGI